MNTIQSRMTARHACVLAFCLVSATGCSGAVDGDAIQRTQSTVEALSAGSPDTNQAPDVDIAPPDDPTNDPVAKPRPKRTPKATGDLCTAAVADCLFDCYMSETSGSAAEEICVSVCVNRWYSCKGIVKAN